MKTMVASKFKAQCIAVLKTAQRDGEPMLITWRGQPLARIEPIASDAAGRRFGVLRTPGSIRGDLIHADWSGDWESNA